MPTARRLQKMQKVLQNRQPDLTVVCENIHDPHNVSAILRTCDAVGIPSIHLVYTTEKFPKLGRKSSASAINWIEIHRHRKYQGVQEMLKKQGMMLYGTSLDSPNMSIYEVDWTLPSAVIVGNEHRGVSDEALAITDHKIYIPMFGMVESLNVSVATAVILYEACRQRLSAANYPADNPEEWLEKKLHHWIKR